MLFLNGSVKLRRINRLLLFTKARHFTFAQKITRNAPEFRINIWRLTTIKILGLQFLFWLTILHIPWSILLKTSFNILDIRIYSLLPFFVLVSIIYSYTLIRPGTTAGWWADRYWIPVLIEEILYRLLKVDLFRNDIVVGFSRCIERIIQNSKILKICGFLRLICRFAIEIIIAIGAVQRIAILLEVFLWVLCFFVGA